MVIVYTVQMLSVRQNGRKKAFGRSPPYQRCLVVLALLLIASGVGSGISIDTQDRRPRRKKTTPRHDR